MDYKPDIYDSVLKSIEKEGHLIAGVYFISGPSLHIVIGKRSQENLCYLGRNREIWATIKRSNGERERREDCLELKKILERFEIKNVKYCHCLD